MCGIIAALLSSNDAQKTADECEGRLMSIAHRGPDAFGHNAIGNNVVMGHVRLAIVDITSGINQPFIVKQNSVTACLTINGEIYNHELIRKMIPEYRYQSKNDCEVVLALANKFYNGAAQRLRGQFAFVWAEVDNRNRLRRWVAARDPLGICPLYYCKSAKGIWFASEMKALTALDGAKTGSIQLFPPGCVMSGDGAGGLSYSQPVSYYSPKWLVDPLSSWIVPTEPGYGESLRRALTRAVQDRLMGDVEIGCFLSGGLDSSLVAAIAASICPKPIHTFCVSLTPDSPDAVFAKQVADWIGSIHHHVEFSVSEAFDEVPNVIYHLESVDVTSVRASTPLYMLCKYIKETHPTIKCLLSGEGADETHMGYGEFHSCADDVDAGLASVERTKNLHMFDIQRCNRAVCASGLEIRVPFLDTSVLELVMTSWPGSRLPRKFNGHRIEKFALRNAFDCDVRIHRTNEFKPYLPPSILWRFKEQFSDGVGSGWVDFMRAHSAKHYGSTELKDAMTEHFGREPNSPEQAMIMQIFLGVLPKELACVVGDQTSTWEPMWTDSVDPSGRVTEGHKKSIGSGKFVATS